MKSIDTNLLVRLIVKDNELQSRKALAYVKKADEIFISHIVLCEFVWVLEFCYDFDKKLLLTILENIFRIENFVFEDSDALWSAWHEYKHNSADFSDCLIAQIAKQHQCTAIGTFDKKATKVKPFELISHV